MGEAAYDKAKRSLEANTPLQATATADRVAESILLFLAGADLITGETLLVDGGHHLMQMPLARR